MARPVDEHKRAELLAAVVGYLEQHGVAELSLRPLAAALGTSSRMLVYYFGTKENLLRKALEVSRPDVPALLAEVRDAAGFRTAVLSVWADMTGGGQRASAPVLLQVMGLAIVPDSPYRAFAAEAVHAWVAPAGEVFVRLGYPEPEALATALVSGIRGLLLDRMITNDHERTDAAVRALVAGVLR